MSFRYRNLYFSCIIVILLVISGVIVGAPAEQGDLVVTEVAWMGTEASYSDEWIEFYNKTGSVIDLESWSIYGASSGECLNFASADGAKTTEIQPYTYIIYAAHNNDVKSKSGSSLVDLWDSTISLNNSSPGELVIYDSNNCTGTVVDRVNQSDGPWFAGDNPETLSMERVSYCRSGTEADNWKDNSPSVSTAGVDEKGNPVKGTPGGDNSVYQNENPGADIDGPDKCNLGDEIQLDGGNSTDCDGYIEAYSWDLNGDGLYDDETGVTATISCQESTKVSLRVRDNGGATGFVSMTIESNEPPTSDFDYSPSNPKRGKEVNFTSLAADPDGSITDWNWNFGDGGSSDVRSPKHVFGEPGTYSVSLTVQDDSGVKDTFSRPITVKPDLEADAGENKTLKLGSSVKLKGDISGNKSVKEIAVAWKLLEGPNGSRLNLDDSNRLDPLFVPKEVGTYRLKLVLSTEQGIEVSDRTTITVKKNPAVKRGKLSTEFLSKSNRTYDKKNEAGLRAEILQTDGPVRGSVIGYELRALPNLDPPSNAFSFKDLKITQLESGLARIDFFYNDNELSSSIQDKKLNLLYFLPKSGWVEAEKISVDAEKNYVSGTIKISNLKGTPLALASESQDGGTEDLVVHGPNPVPEKGCVFWFDLPNGAKKGRLKIFDVDGKLLTEIKLTKGQKRFPAGGRWQPKDANGNLFNSGIYLYRLKFHESGKTHWTEVKKLAIE